MRRFYKITPEGTRDLLFSEAKEMMNIESKVCKGFESYGYRPVKTPVLEFYDTFNVGVSGIAQEDMFKLSDYKGRLLALRPDNTFPVARLVSTALKNAERPLRIYYDQSVYSVRNSYRGRRNQYRQAGIELIGASGKMADIEVMTLAMETLISAGFDFRFELGHAEFFKLLVDELPIDDGMRENIREIVESKNYAELSEMLDGLEASPAVDAVKKLPRLFGGAEIIEEAKKLCRGLKCTQCLDYLGEIYSDLEKLGYGDKVIIDLGLVHRNDYYTGVIFGCYIDGVGDSVLNGGRYDNLLKQFGEDDPAVGFAVDLSYLTKTVTAKNEHTESSPDILIYSEKGYEVEAVIKIRELTTQNPNIKVFNGYFNSYEEAKKYAEKYGIPKIITVGTEEKD